MALGNLSGCGLLNSGTPTPVTNKIYLNSILINFGYEGTRFNFYASSQIQSYNDLVNYLNNHGASAGTGNLIYCFGINGSQNNQNIIPQQLKNDQNNYKVVATGYQTSNGGYLTADITSNYPSNYFLSYEV